jgi:hypothetical protein
VKKLGHGVIWNFSSSPAAFPLAAGKLQNYPLAKLLDFSYV